MSDFRMVDIVAESESLRIDQNKKKITAILAVFKFVDKDTHQHIFYIPSLEVTGYGEIPEKAEEMAKASLDDTALFLLNLEPEELLKELSRWGWKKKLFNKQFSKSYVDMGGELRNFNVEESSIQRLTLTAA
jgi:hypothetical protein